MAEVQERTIIEEGKVKITTMRIIIGTVTYALSDVTSVNLVKKKLEFPYILFFIIGLGGMLISNGIDLQWTGGLLMTIGSLYGYMEARKKYVIEIRIGHDEINILESKDDTHLRRLVETLQAILAIKRSSLP